MEKLEKIAGELKYVMCALLCLISMILTGCFALSFGSVNSSANNTAFILWSPILLLAVGVALDLSKYIFWAVHNKKWHQAYKLLAVILMLFSWMASVAFFITSEDEKISTFRKQTADYLSYQTQLSDLDRNIETKSQLLNNRLNSRFHDQWEKGEIITQEIQVLQQQRKTLIAQEQNIGIQDAYDHLVSLAFFNAIATMTNTDKNTVRNIFYAILALLIEVCALGLIGVCRLDKKGLVLAAPSPPLGSQTSALIEQRDNSQFIQDSPETLADAEISRLIEDIKRGSVPPVFNQIKALNYNLSQKDIRLTLQTLKEMGVLKEGSRRSLVLA